MAAPVRAATAAALAPSFRTGFAPLLFTPENLMYSKNRRGKRFYI